MTMINPIFIRTKVGSRTVFTVWQSNNGGEWITLLGNGDVLKAKNLSEAGINHLRTAYTMHDQLAGSNNKNYG